MLKCAIPKNKDILLYNHNRAMISGNLTVRSYYYPHSIFICYHWPTNSLYSYFVSWLMIQSKSHPHVSLVSFHLKWFCLMLAHNSLRQCIFGRKTVKGCCVLFSISFQESHNVHVSQYSHCWLWFLEWGQMSSRLFSTSSSYYFLFASDTMWRYFEAM